MILVTLRLTIPPHKRREIKKTLRSIVGPTRVEPGCASCRSYQDEEAENVLSLVEEWTTEADFRRHLRSDQYRKILAIIESAVEPPEIKINTVSHVAGIEVIEEARAN